MKLDEKILYCRKRAGLSQEELGEKIGVSRQAISKWETGESVPELGKIILLADIFQVTTDWLLKDGEGEEVRDSKEAQAVNITPNWVESIPGVIGNLIKKYGWLFGVYLAISGAISIGFGIAGKLMFRSFMQNSPFSNETTFFFDAPGFSASNSFGFGVSSDPSSYITGFVIILGTIFLVGGIILAIVLKRKGVEKV
ncbi:MAG: helix-turn-helix transcriptional regulator [Firmicutes bacterium]|nr:helix-turn-helix transcriptional regulator [Bacillota bacterium]